MDTSARAADIAASQYGIVVRRGEVGSSVWDDLRFDFITMFHVLEHLPRPKQALRWASQLLKPAGTLIVQVPNAASLQARVFRGAWYGLDVPRHVINFTPKSLDIVLGETGLEFRRVSRFSLRDNPASIASSIALRLDPMSRRCRGLDSHPLVRVFTEAAYFSVVLLVLAPALIESTLGFGGTIWAYAKKKPVVR